MDNYDDADFLFFVKRILKRMLNIPSVERKLDALCQRVIIISSFHSFGPKCMGHKWGFLQAYKPIENTKTANTVILKAIKESSRRTVGERK